MSKTWDEMRAEEAAAAERLDNPFKPVGPTIVERWGEEFLAEERNERPFANGTQFYDWQARNCERCLKSTVIHGDDGTQFWELLHCRIEHDLHFAAVYNGAISENTAKRMGLPGNELALTWDCPEREVRP